MAIAQTRHSSGVTAGGDTYEPGTHPDLPPPRRDSGAVAWIRQNLFSSPFDIAMTVLATYLLATLLPALFSWAVANATWSGDSRADCMPGGACWVFIKVRFEQFVFGFYPEEERWRVVFTATILALLGALLVVPRVPHKLWIAAFTLLIFPLIAYILLIGGSFGLTYVESPKWGGVFLTVVVAIVGMVIALALGIVMALGRRSDLPIIRMLCTTYIEFIRAVPLITILFMASVMLPLFLPAGVTFDKVLRALIGVAVFWAAYMAEAVRAGLQAIPRGQEEAAKALGLNYWALTGLVVLPQALKHSIPSIMNTFISLVKDTTLLLLIGILELLGIVQAATANPKWLGSATEGYVFVALIFFCFCFGMSWYSQKLEKKLDTGH